MLIEEVKAVKSTLFFPLFLRLRLEPYNLSFAESVIYSLYADRCGISIKTAKSNQGRFIDDKGEPFIYFLDADIGAITQFGRDKIKAAKQTLREKNLIRTKGRQPQRIYVTFTPSVEEFRRAQNGSKTKQLESGLLSD